MNMNIRSRTSALVAMATISIAACGGGGSTGLATAELTRELDKVCTKVQADFEALDQPVDQATAATFFEASLKASERGLVDLKAIKAADKADAGSLTKMIDAISAANGQMVKMAAAAKSEDATAGEAAVAKYDEHIATFRKQADIIGSEDCAAIGETPTEPEPATTEPPVTEPTTTVAPTTTAAPETTVAPVVIDTVPLGSFIEPPAGYDVEEVDEAIVADIAATIAATPGASDYITAIGAGTAENAEGLNRVLGVQLTRELSDTELEDFLGGIVENAVDVEVTTLGGLNGVAFQESDGRVGFSAVIGTTAFIVSSTDIVQLTAIMEALALANGGETPTAGGVGVVASDTLITYPAEFTATPMPVTELNDLATVMASRPLVLAQVLQVGGARVANANGTHWVVVMQLADPNLDETAGQAFIEALIGDPETGTPAWEFQEIGGIRGIHYIDAEGLPTFITAANDDVLIWASSANDDLLTELVSALVTVNNL